MAKTRNIYKQLAVMEDLALGTGDLSQTRGGVTRTVHAVDVPVAVNAQADMQALDLNAFRHARVYTSTTKYTDYIYDPADDTGIPSDDVTATGSWIVVIGSNTGGDDTLIQEAIEASKPYGKSLTLAEGVASTIAKVGDTVIISDRGNGLFEYKTGQINNTFNIVECAGVVGLSLVLVRSKLMSAECFGLHGDGVVINDSAFLAMVSEPGRYVFDREDGVYLFNNAYAAGAVDVELSCARGARIKRADGAYGTNPDGAISGMLDFVGGFKLKLVSMFVDCNKTGATPIGGTHLNGINFYKCNDVSSYLCDFGQAEYTGLNHQGCNDVRIQSCIISDCDWACSAATGGYFNDYGAERIRVVGNTFNRTWAGFQSQVSTKHLIVENNHFINSSLILAQDVNFGSLSYNVFDGPAPDSLSQGDVAQEALLIEADSNLQIHGNTINNSARGGISVAGNYMPNGPSEGVMVCDNLSIIGNEITNCPATGIIFNPGSQYTYNLATSQATLQSDQSLWTRGKNSILRDNIVVACGGAGIQASIMQSTLIRSNSLSLNLLSGLIVGHSKSTRVEHNEVYNNSTVGADLHDGVQVDLGAAIVDDLTIAYNNVYDNQSVRTQRYGVNNQNVACTSFKMFANSFTRNGTDYISVVDYLPFVVIAAALQGGATNFGGGFAPASYYKDNNNIVHLRGMVNLGAASVGAVLFTLASNNYKPKLDEMFSTIANQAFSRVDVKANGDVVVGVAANNNYLSLSGISFAVGG